MCWHSHRSQAPEVLMTPSACQKSLPARITATGYPDRESTARLAEVTARVAGRRCTTTKWRYQCPLLWSFNIHYQDQSGLEFSEWSRCYTVALQTCRMAYPTHQISRIRPSITKAVFCPYSLLSKTLGGLATIYPTSLDILQCRPADCSWST